MAGQLTQENFCGLDGVNVEEFRWFLWRTVCDRLNACGCTDIIFEDARGKNIPNNLRVLGNDPRITRAIDYGLAVGIIGDFQLAFQERGVLMEGVDDAVAAFGGGVKAAGNGFPQGML